MLEARKYVELYKEEIDMAHWYILKKCEEIDSYFEFVHYFLELQLTLTKITYTYNHPYSREPKEELRQESEVNIKQRHKDTFPTWLRRCVSTCYLLICCHIILY